MSYFKIEVRFKKTYLNKILTKHQKICKINEKVI